MYGAGAAWSRLFLPGAGAGVGSGTLAIRSRSRPKKWRLSNTDKNLRSINNGAEGNNCLRTFGIHVEESSWNHQYFYLLLERGRAGPLGRLHGSSSLTVLRISSEMDSSVIKGGEESGPGSRGGTPALSLNTPDYNHMKYGTGSYF